LDFYKDIAPLVQRLVNYKLSLMPNEYNSLYIEIFASFYIIPIIPIGEDEPESILFSTHITPDKIEDIIKEDLISKNLTEFGYFAIF
jgi:hypothetical protein